MQQHFTVKRFGDIIVGAQFIALNDIVFHGFGAQEKQGNIGVNIPNFFRYGKAIHIGHHYIEQANVKFFPLKSGKPKAAIPFQRYIIVVQLQVIF